MSFQLSKKRSHHCKSNLIIEIIRWRKTLVRSALYKRRKNALLEIIILTTKEKKLINDCNSMCERKDCSRANLISCTTRFNFFESKRTFMSSLSSSISRKSIVVSHISFLWLIINFNSTHKSSNWLWYNIVLWCYLKEWYQNELISIWERFVMLQESRSQ